MYAKFAIDKDDFQKSLLSRSVDRPAAIAAVLRRLRTISFFESSCLVCCSILTTSYLDFVHVYFFGPRGFVVLVQ